MSVLRQSRSVAEIPVRAHVIESVRPGVTGNHAQAVEISGVQRHLQAVVIRPIDIPHLEDVAQIGELRREWLIGLLVSVVIDNAVVVHRGALPGIGVNAPFPGPFPIPIPPAAG